MSLNKEKAQELKNMRLPLFGWLDDGEGWLVAPDDFAQDHSFITPEYAAFAERTRARWDLIQYLRTILNQWKAKKEDTAKTEEM